MEVAGSAIGAFPFALELLVNVAETRQRIRDKTLTSRSKLKEDSGFFSSWFLLIFFPGTRRIMIKVERYVLHAKDEEVVSFLKSYTSSFNMIGIAGAIIAQVAITAMSLIRLTDSHWTAQAFFLISLVTGALSVFFSCAISPAFHDLHNADDIKSFFTKPSSSKKRQELHNLLRASERNRSDPGNLAKLTAFVSEGRWKVASAHSAIMLVVPMNLLNIALNAFLLGLGVYFGKLYTADLVPSFRSGSLALLIIFVGTSVFGIAMFYIPQGFKAVEDGPMLRYQRLLRKLDSTPLLPAVDNQAVRRPTSQGPNEANAISQSAHIRTGSRVQYTIPESADQTQDVVASGPSTALETTQPLQPDLHIGDTLSEQPYLAHENSEQAPNLSSSARTEIRLAISSLIQAQESGLKASKQLLLALDDMRT